MKKQVSKTTRKVAVIIHYLSLGLLNCLIIFQENIDALVLLLTGIIISLAIVIISFIYAFGLTRLWILTHSSYKKLDERQIQVSYSALSVSYNIFSIILLSILMFYSLSGITIHILVVGSLIYVSHILPGSVIACTEKQV